MTSNPLPKNGPHKPGTVGTAQGSVQARYVVPCSNVPRSQEAAAVILAPNALRAEIVTLMRRACVC